MKELIFNNRFSTGNEGRAADKTPPTPIIGLTRGCKASDGFGALATSKKDLRINLLNDII
jgi:hypothetical protein